jgi:uncharacterized protein
MPEPDPTAARGREPAGPPEQAPTRDPGGRPPARISATPAACEAICRLRAARGEDLMFVQSAGCCAGSAPMCFPAGEFIVGDVDLLLGVIEGCPFYIDARIYQSWDHPQLVLDVAPGNPEGFSLGPGGRLHFVTRASACTPPRADPTAGHLRKPARSSPSRSRISDPVLP